MTSGKLMTPIYLKTSADMPLPTGEPAFLLLSGNGMWMCRNHEFFQSCAPARSWPCELAKHKSSLVLTHPKIPPAMLEQIVGFFAAIAQKHEAEAGALLIWDKSRQDMEVYVPRQLATVGESWAGKLYPIGLHYDLPTDLGPDRIIVADVHSHVYHSAYSSYQDKYDEEYRAGLHVVVGRLDLEPPQFHAEFVVDGERFIVESAQVMDGYESKSNDFPQAWLDRVSVRIYGPGQDTWTAYDGSAPAPLPPRKTREHDDDETIG